LIGEVDFPVGAEDEGAGLWPWSGGKYEEALVFEATRSRA